MTAARLALAVLLSAFLGASSPAQAAEVLPGMKSGSEALLFSIGGTVLPIGAGAAMAAINANSSSNAVPAGLILGGYILGPSVGHFYAARPGRALLGIGIRGAAVTGLAVALGHALDESGGSTSAEFWILGFIVGTGSLVFDICDAPRSARIHNEKVRAHRISITPTVIGQDHTPGLAVGLAF